MMELGGSHSKHELYVEKHEHKYTMTIEEGIKVFMDKSIEEELLHVMEEWLRKHYLS